MRLRKVQYRDYCFIRPNTVRHEGYFKTRIFYSINYYMINDTTIGYCVWYVDKRFNI